MRYVFGAVFDLKPAPVGDGLRRGEPASWLFPELAFWSARTCPRFQSGDMSPHSKKPGTSVRIRTFRKRLAFRKVLARGSGKPAARQLGRPTWSRSPLASSFSHQRFGHCCGERAFCSLWPACCRPAFSRLLC
jgi:hypothetical protein